MSDQEQEPDITGGEEEEEDEEVEEEVDGKSRRLLPFASHVFCAFVVLTNIDTLSPFLTVEDVAQPDDEDEDSDDDGE